MSGDIWKMLSEVPEEEHERGGGVSAPLANNGSLLQRLARTLQEVAASAMGRTQEMVDSLKTASFTRVGGAINRHNFKKLIKGKQSVTLRILSRGGG